MGTVSAAQVVRLTNTPDVDEEDAVFSPDGSLVAAGSQDTICVWATETGKLVSRMKLPENVGGLKVENGELVLQEK